MRRFFQSFRRYAPRFFATLALLGMIVYTVYHVMSSSAEGLMTTPAQPITDVQILTSDAYLFRDETVLSVLSNGLVQPIAQSGSKLSKDAPVAEVYSYDESLLATAQTELDILNRYISVLELSAPPSGSTLADAQVWRAEARNLYLDILRAAQSGKLQGIGDLEDSMLMLLNRYQTLPVGATDSAELLSALKQQRASLLHTHTQTVSNDRASGYFYDRTQVDGYEETFSLAALETLTVSGFDALTAAEPVLSAEGTTGGKMAYGHEWYLAIRLDDASAAYFEEDVRYRVTFSENGDRELILTCEKLLREAGIEGAVAVLSCRDYPAEFTFSRVQKVKLSVRSMSGYYVPESALQNVGGVDGVYIFENLTVRFRRVDILYRGDGYCIVAEKGERGDDYLNLNDLLITYGQKLYDGKVY